MHENIVSVPLSAHSPQGLHMHNRLVGDTRAPCIPGPWTCPWGARRAVQVTTGLVDRAQPAYCGTAHTSGTVCPAVQGGHARLMHGGGRDPWRRAARGAQAVQGAVAETLPDAVQAAVADRLRFDVRANVLTLLAITGVIMYWRGIWSLWRAALRPPCSARSACRASTCDASPGIQELSGAALLCSAYT